MDIPKVDSLEDLGRAINLDKGTIDIQTPPEPKKEEEPKADANNSEDNAEPKEQESNNNNEEVTKSESTEEAASTKEDVVSSDKDNNSSLTDDTVKPESQQQETDDFDERFTSRLKEEGYVKREELEKELSEKPATENDLLSELLKIEKEGGEVTKDWLREYLTDYEKYNPSNISDAVQLAKQQIMESEGLDEVDADFEVQDRYNALFEEDADPDSQEYKRAKRKLEIQAKKHLSKKKEAQSKLSLPDGSRKPVNKEELINEFVEEAKAKQAEQTEQLKNFLTNASRRISSKLDKVNIEVDGESFEYEPSQDVKKQVEKAVKGYTTFLDDNFIKDGKLDEQGLGEFFTKFYAEKEVMKMVRGKSKAEGKEEFVKDELKNASVEKTGTKSPEPSNDPQLELGKQLLEKGAIF